MSCIKTNFHKLLIVRRKTVDDVDDQWLSELRLDLQLKMDPHSPASVSQRAAVERE